MRWGAGLCATVTADAESVSSGLTGADGSVSYVLCLVDKCTNYNMVRFLSRECISKDEVISG